MFNFFKKKKLLPGAIFYESKHYYPAFPSVVLQHHDNEITALQFHLSGNGYVSFCKIGRIAVDELDTESPIQEKVATYIKECYESYIKDGNTHFKKFGGDAKQSEVIEKVIEENDKKYDIYVSAMGGETFHVFADPVKDTYAWEIYNRLALSIKNETTCEIRFGNGKALYNGKHLSKVSIVETKK